MPETGRPQVRRERFCFPLVSAEGGPHSPRSQRAPSESVPQTGMWTSEWWAGQ